MIKVVFVTVSMLLVSGNIWTLLVIFNNIELFCNVAIFYVIFFAVTANALSQKQNDSLQLHPDLFIIGGHPADPRKLVATYSFPFIQVTNLISNSFCILCYWLILDIQMHIHGKLAFKLKATINGFTLAADRS